MKFLNIRVLTLVSIFVHLICANCVKDTNAVDSFESEDCDGVKQRKPQDVQEKEENNGKSGYLTLNIEGVLATNVNGKNCDYFYPFVKCDPFVKVFVDNEEVYRTRTLYQTPGAAIFNEKYKSKLITKDTPVRIEVWDRDITYNDLIQNWDATAGDILKEGAKGDGFNLIVAPSTWDYDEDD